MRSALALALLGATLWTSPALQGQTAAPEAKPATAPPKVAGPLDEASVRATLEHLCSDEMAGRDTPSAELDRAADWIAKRFREAGLASGAGEKCFHEYSLPGRSFATGGGFILTVKTPEGDKQLEPGVDVRLFRAQSAFAEEEVEFDRWDASSTDRRKFVLAQRTRRPLLVEIDPSNPVWRATEGTKQVLAPRSRGGGRPPVFLVRKGLLPPGVIKGRAAVPAPEKIDLALRNVVGVLKGTKRPEERIIISAHYDHIGVGLPFADDGVFNGADDDATGTTAVIQLAQAFAKAGARERTLVFVAFSAEEKGLRGSAAFAEKPPFALDTVVANLNLEMLGRPDEKDRFTAWMTGRDLSDLEDRLRPGFERAGITLREFEMQRQLFRASDNFSLARQGVVAQSVSAGGLHEDYHQPTDELAKIDVPHMTRVIKGIFEAAGDLADQKDRPAYNAAGKKILN
ncbi:MAG: M20/M25/M40 family metallo-hydrolase [Planctomycetota bacterium]